jgi:hypothetical protein
MNYDSPDNEKAHNAKSIYKYVAINSEESFNRLENMMRNRSLWFWPLTKQNDPNECKPVCYFGGSKNDKIKYFIEIINEEFPGKYTRESVLQKPRGPQKYPKYQPQ